MAGTVAAGLAVDPWDDAIVSGRVVILNGVPRSGKSSIAQALIATEPGWVNHGVDASMAATPEPLLPGVGLRPGGERPDLEPEVERLYRALWDRVATLADAGGDVVVDVGLHSDFAADLDPWAIAADALRSCDVLVVGVRAPLDAVLERRAAATGYLTAAETGPVPDAIRRWEAAVHDPGHYDMEVDTTVSSPAECAALILRRLARGPRDRALTNRHHSE
ncbi:MAG: chloramphenicol phosphotransferase [Actinomycetota bacterium]